MRSGKACRKVTLQPNQIKNVLVEPSQIMLTRVDGCKLVNTNPTSQEKLFWSNYKTPQQSKATRWDMPKATRWDMPSPDPLAIAALEEWDQKELK